MRRNKRGSKAGGTALLIFSFFLVSNIRAQEETILLEKAEDLRSKAPLARKVLRDLALEGEDKPLEEAWAWVILGKDREAGSCLERVPESSRKGRLWQGFLRDLALASLKYDNMIKLGCEILGKETRKDGADARLLGAAGAVLYKAGKRLEAFEALKKAVKLGDRRRETAGLLYEISVSLDQEGNTMKSIEGFRTLYRAFPGEEWSIMNLCIALRRGGFYSRAEEILKEAINRKINVPVFMNELGLLYKALGKRELAEECFRKASPLLDDGKTNLAMLKFREGRKKEVSRMLLPLVLRKTKEKKPFGKFSLLLFVRSGFCSENKVF